VFAYIVRRLALMLVTLFGISVIIFVLLRIVPGNIVDILFDAAGYVDPADKAHLEQELGPEAEQPKTQQAQPQRERELDPVQLRPHPYEFFLYHDV